MNVIETQKLSKRYGTHEVLQNLDMQIEKGKLVGFLGPNGAGKTTTIRILMGLLSATSGSANIFGQPVKTSGKTIRANIGYLPGDVHLYSNLTGMQLLKFYAKARRIDCMQEAKRLAGVLALPLDRNIRKFSTGMRQKLGLIQAMMHRPKLLILDEPTSALDPLVRVEVIQELRNVTKDGRTVLFSSHSLDEVESLCDEVIILRDGQIVEQQKIDILKGRALRKVKITFASDPNSIEYPAGLKIFSTNNRMATCTWSGNIKPFLRWIENQEIVDLIIERTDLNDLFINYYADETVNTNV